MRGFSYILLTLVIVFFANVAASFIFPEYRLALVALRSQAFSELKKPAIDMRDKIEKNRLADSLNRINEHMVSLSESKAIEEKTSSGSTLVNSLNTTLSGAVKQTASGARVSEKENIVPKELDIPLSGVFLAKIMPDILLKKIENKGFFGIQIFTKLAYSTYSDDRRGVKVYAFNDNYDTLLVNLKLVNNMYEINETDQFFGFTFFLNPIKKDKTIRFVTSIEGKAVGIEVTKAYYPALKKILLKK